MPDAYWNNQPIESSKIHAIKYMRSITGLGLKEAKDAVEQGTWHPINWNEGNTSRSLIQTLKATNIPFQVK